jgi:hypothetical protein
MVIERNDPTLQAIAKVINNEGGLPGHSLHSWRCEREPSCDCVAGLAEEILIAIRPLIEAQVREQIARDIAARIFVRVDRLQGYELDQRDGALEALREVLSDVWGGDHE